MIAPLKILKDAIEKVPFVKYALGIAGIGAAIAIIRSFGITNSSIPVISILVMLGFMILLFLFSVLTKSKEKPLKIAGYFLIYTTVLITCASSVLLVTSVFFDIPKPISEYSIFSDSTSEDTKPTKQDTLENETDAEVPDKRKKVEPDQLERDSNTTKDQKNQLKEEPTETSEIELPIEMLEIIERKKLITKVDYALTTASSAALAEELQLNLHYGSRQTLKKDRISEPSYFYLAETHLQGVKSLENTQFRTKYGLEVKNNILKVYHIENEVKEVIYTSAFEEKKIDFKKLEAIGKKIYHDKLKEKLK